LLTGTTVAKVKAAALDAAPGGTIIRVENDSDGSPYEAHVRKPDASVVTVKVDDAFAVTSTESGFGAGAPSPSGGSGA
jgi:soluble lytic murein transglycosylase-like protein